jgi:hypothetical protein
LKKKQQNDCSRSAYLSKVTSSTGGIQNLQFHFFVGAEYENSAAGHGHATHAELRIDHAEKVRELPRGISDDGIVEGAESIVTLHVLNPAKMISNAVARQRDDLIVS